MWMIAMFDLPVETNEDRKHATQFRNLLLREGYSMLQFSVYGRYFPSEEASEPYKKRIRQSIPPRGEVRLLYITDKQFEKMEIFVSKKKRKAEEPTPQLLLF
ncbi:MAG: CRISPR-associated endonuclease Cas2 [Candidatus Hydrogenedens sp.]